MLYCISTVYRHGTKVHSELASGRRGNKRNFAGCFYLTSGLGFLRSWLIEPQFNEHSLHGRLAIKSLLLCYIQYQSCFNFQRTIRLLLDTRGASNTFGLGIDREMALAIYRVGSEHEYAEVQ